MSETISELVDKCIRVVYSCVCIARQSNQMGGIALCSL
jgi:hypothetical protein